MTEIVRAEGVDEIVKVKSLTTDEIGLNDALEAVGIHALETDLAELIVQLAGERPHTFSCPRSTRTGPRSATCSGSGSGSKVSPTIPAS